MSLSQTCQTILEKVDDGLACALIDLESGLLLGIHNRATYLTEAYLDAVAAASVEMFRGRNVRVVEEMISQHRDSEPSRMIQEIQMSTERTYHFMSVLPEKKHMLAMLITGRRTNLGMGWATLRAGLPELSRHCP